MSFPRTAAVAARLEVVAETGSTNADLREKASDAAGWPHFSVLLTRNQTAGRGRLDREWSAPPGAALAVSVLLRDTAIPVAARGWIPLVAGAAMADAVSAQLPRREVSVKWPNDVLVEPVPGAADAGGKICGILAEAAGDDVIVVGAGVNTAMSVSQLPVPTATSFVALGETCEEDRLVADYLRRLNELLSALAATGDAVAGGVHAAVTSRCGTLGQRVRVSLPGGGELTGRAVRLEADGRLVVDDDGLVHSVGAGDVVHVRPASDR